MRTISFPRAAIALAALLLPATATQAQLAKGQCKFLGNITDGTVPSDYNTYWNQMSPENCGKWGSVQSNSTGTSYNWNGMKGLASWSKSTGNPYKYHVLVWGQQQPSDVGSGTTIATIEKWFDAVQKQFPDAPMIDVVNEAYPGHAPAAYKNALKTAAAADGIPSSDYDWIFEAFKMARKRWPNTILIYNDYNNIEYDAENNWQVAMCKLAKTQNIPIDAIGVQSHDVYKVSTSSVKAKIDKIAATGFPIYVTEYDIGESDDAKQKSIMAEQMTMFWNHPSIKGVTYWGITVGKTWRTGTGLQSASGVNRPALDWLKTWIPANKAVCGTDGVEIHPNPQAVTRTGLVMREVSGHLVVGTERDGRFTAVSALGRN